MGITKSPSSNKMAGPRMPYEHLLKRKPVGYAPEQARARPSLQNRFNFGEMERDAVINHTVKYNRKHNRKHYLNQIMFA